jgi:adenylate kinase family enzyme
MSSKLIIIRGNSGSGKSTVAKKLQHKLGYNTMLIPQDVVRREILRVKETDGNPSTELIRQIAIYGRDIGYNVIIEGILVNKRHKEMLESLIKEFSRSYVYYFDIPFEETLRRHQSKSADFGETEMREWWHEKNYLGVKDEVLIGESMNEDEITNMIFENVIFD